MSKSQQEINYENALKEKNEAGVAYNQELSKLAASDKELEIQRPVRDTIRSFTACGGWHYDKTKYDLTSIGNYIQSIIPPVVAGLLDWCGQVQYYMNSQEGQRCASIVNNYNLELAKNESLKISVKQLKKNWEDATVKANDAYEDWLDWKKANMTPEELQDFYEVEEDRRSGFLKQDILKWTSIGLGIVVFGFGVWYLIKRFR